MTVARNSGRVSVKPANYEPTISGQQYGPALRYFPSASEIAFYKVMKVINDFEADEVATIAGQ